MVLGLATTGRSLLAAGLLVSSLAAHGQSTGWHLGLEGGGAQVFCRQMAEFEDYFGTAFYKHSSYYGVRSLYQATRHWAFATGIFNTHMDVVQQWRPEESAALPANIGAAESRQQTQWLTIPLSMRLYTGWEQRPRFFLEAGISANVRTGQRGSLSYFSNASERRSANGGGEVPEQALRSIWLRANLSLGLQFRLSERLRFTVNTEYTRGLSSVYKNKVATTYAPGDNGNAAYGFRLALLYYTGAFPERAQ